MNDIQLRTLITAQIAASLVGRVAPNTPDSQIQAIAETAAKIAKAVQDAAIRSF